MPITAKDKPPVRPGGKLICAADIVPRELRWLWYPYIPMGTATMIFGAGGIGKSHIACEIAARVTTGDGLPGQRGSRRPQKVLIMSAEDDPEVVLQPRLVRAGADLQNIFIPEQPFVLDQRGIDSMEQFMRACAATVVFIDPIVAYMGGKMDMNRMNEVRSLTAPLTRAGRDTESAVIIVHHSRKGTEGEDFERAAGSVDFINAVRSTLYVAKAPDGTRVMRHVKSNYAALGPTLAYEFGGDDDFRWLGEFDDNAVMQPKGAKAAEAVVFLKELLANGPVAAKEVMAMAADEGISDTTLNRVKPKVASSYLKVEGETKTWFWKLKGEDE